MTNEAATIPLRPQAANENRRLMRPSPEEAKEAVRTLIRWAGDDPGREGLLDTPQRVIDAYGEFYEGYGQDPQRILSKVFEEVEGYDEIVLLKNMRFESHCEHHMVAFIGVAHIAYLPDKKIVGISKIARLLDVFAHRAADAGGHDLADRRLHRGSARPARRRRHHRRRAPVHDHPRRAQGRHLDRDLADARIVPHGFESARGTDAAD